MKNIYKTMQLIFWLYALGAPFLYLLIPARHIAELAIAALGFAWAYIIACYRGKTDLYNCKPVQKVLKIFLLNAVPLAHLVTATLMIFGNLPKFSGGLL